MAYLGQRLTQNLFRCEPLFEVLVFDLELVVLDAELQRVKPARSRSGHPRAFDVPFAAVAGANEFFRPRVDRTAEVRADARKDLHAFAISDYPHRTLSLELAPAGVLRNDYVLLDQLAFREFAERTKVSPFLLVRGRERRRDRISPDRHAQYGRNSGDDQAADYA